MFLLCAQAICMHRAHDYQFITLPYPQLRSLLSSIAKADVRAYRDAQKTDIKIFTLSYFPQREKAESLQHLS